MSKEINNEGREDPMVFETLPIVGRPEVNPFHPSRDPLAAILPLFPGCLQFPIPLGLNLVLFPAEAGQRRVGGES